MILTKANALIGGCLATLAFAVVSTFAASQEQERPTILFPAGTMQLYAPVPFTLEQTDAYLLMRWKAGPHPVPPTPVPPGPGPVPPTPDPGPPRPDWLPDGPPPRPSPTPNPQAGLPVAREDEPVPPEPAPAGVEMGKVGPWEWRASKWPGYEVRGRWVEGTFLVAKYRKAVK